MKSTARATAAVSFLILAGCVSPTDITQTMSTPASVAFEFAPDVHSKQSIADRAQAHCRSYRKDAEVVGVQGGRSQAYTEVIFKCI